MQADLGIIGTEFLDVGRHLHLFLVNFGAGKPGELIGHILAGHLAVELARRAALDLDGDDLALDFCSQVLSRRFGLRLMVGLGFALGACRVQGIGVRRRSQAAGQQIIAGLAVRDLMDLILLADALDILFENHFHGKIPSL